MAALLNALPAGEDLTAAGAGWAMRQVMTDDVESWRWPGSSWRCAPRPAPGRRGTLPGPGGDLLPVRAAHHRRLRHAGPVRRTLGVPTVIN